jgi:DNA processing protein
VEARLLPRTDPRYPARLARLADAPPLLFVRGEPCFDMPTVALVGARAATTAGRRFARELAFELAAAGVCVASGLARGIDAEAHRGALDAGGKSVAFLGCGIDRVYPPEHARLAAALARAGAVFSEFPLAVPPRAPHFPLRNRLISACADAVVVVEARERSGTLVTARHALDQGVDVWAAPGPLYAPSHTGSNGLLRDGAAPLVAAEDLLASLSIAPRPVEPATGVAPADPILRVLRDAPSTRDELARAFGTTPEGLAARLLELELAGRVREDADGRLHVSR